MCPQSLFRRSEIASNDQQSERNQSDQGSCNANPGFARDEGLGIALVLQSRVVRRTRVRTGLRVGGLWGRQGEFAGRIRRSMMGKRRVFDLNDTALSSFRSSRDLFAEAARRQHHGRFLEAMKNLSWDSVGCRG